MRRFISLAALGLVACSGGDADDGGTTIEPMDAGIIFDATVVDSGRRDAGDEETPDAGFADPSTILQGKESILGQSAYIHVKGTVTSTMPPVFFLNTGPMQGHEYLLEPFEFMLGPGGREDPDRLLIFADLRATGRSGFGSIDSSTVTFESHLGDVERYMDYLEDKLGFDGPYDLVGHGYGAGVAINFEVLHPRRVNRMVLISPHPSNPTEHADFMGEWDARLSSADRERRIRLTMWFNCLPNLQRCSRDLWNLMGPTFFCPANKNLFDTMRFEHIDIRPFGLYVLPELTEDNYDWVPVMRQVQAPTTVFIGVHDPGSTRTPVADKYGDEIPGAIKHRMSNSGHFPFVEEPDRFQSLFKRALAYP